MRDELALPLFEVTDQIASFAWNLETVRGHHQALNAAMKREAAFLAAATPFGGLIVQGSVTSGLLNAVVAEDLPGPGTVFLQVDWRFVKAVRLGEAITARAEVTSVRDDKPTCTLATTVHNEAGELCLSGTATTFTVPLRPATAPS